MPGLFLSVKLVDGFLGFNDIIVDLGANIVLPLFLFTFEKFN